MGLEGPKREEIFFFHIFPFFWWESYFLTIYIEIYQVTTFYSQFDPPKIAEEERHFFWPQKKSNLQISIFYQFSPQKTSLKKVSNQNLKDLAHFSLDGHLQLLCFHLYLFSDFS